MCAGKRFLARARGCQSGKTHDPHDFAAWAIQPALNETIAVTASHAIQLPASSETRCICLRI
jgi:hypothetical protein